MARGLSLPHMIVDLLPARLWSIYLSRKSLEHPATMPSTNKLLLTGTIICLWTFNDLPIALSLAGIIVSLLLLYYDEEPPLI